MSFQVISEMGMDDAGNIDITLYKSEGIAEEKKLNLTPYEASVLIGDLCEGLGLFIKDISNKEKKHLAKCLKRGQQAIKWGY